MKDFCPHFVDDVNLLAWHRGFREGDRKLRCAKCQAVVAHKYNGKYQVWGPSKDEPESVRIEIRASEIAASLGDKSKLSHEIDFRGTEFEGWRRLETINLHVEYEDGSERSDHGVPLNLESPNWLAGYLAREIVS